MMRIMRIWLFVAGIMGALAVLCGAFAAHGLATRLDENARSVFETGARYHMYHALAIGLAAFAMRGPAEGGARAAAILFLIGILLFSGSLYLLALTGNTVLGFVTPFGGLAFIAGWILLALAALKLPPLNP
jgi:uncharacterized membrane protein YgdD (TMEM256/DUF423 family)